ncbi:MAG: tetratricopeptide repeat protein [Bacteroidales bacterium]
MKLLKLIFLFVPVLAYAENNTKQDSLLNLINEEQNDTLRAEYYLQIGDLFQYDEQDTAIYYYHKALDIAQQNNLPAIEAKCYNYIGVVYLYQSEFDTTKQYFLKSLSIKRAIDDKAGMANSYNNLGIIAKNRGDFARAISYYDSALTIRKQLVEQQIEEDEKIENIKKVGHAHMNIGNVQYQLGRYTEALGSYKESLSNYNSIDHKKGIAGCYNNIGSIFEEQQEYNTAIDYYKQSLEISLSVDQPRDIGTAYNNIGEVYLKQSDLKRALKNFEESLKYREQTNDKRGISAVYSNLSMIYYEQGNYEKAISMIDKALKIDYQIDDKVGIAEDLNYLSKINLKKKDYFETIDMAKRSLSISRSIDAPRQSKESHNLLFQAYEQMGDSKTALYHHKKYKELDDQLFNKEKHKQIQEIEQKYQTEKNLQQLAKKEVELSEQKARLRHQKNLKYIFFAGLIFLLVFLFLIYRNFQQKRRDNTLLIQQKEEIEAQNEELQQQNEEIVTQRDELETQRDIANSQKTAIATKNNEITHSIQYAKGIQSALLPQDYQISRLLDEYFIFFKPKDIVSGDFYWFGEKEGKTIIACADCTGHGVPGAFMSLLGMSLLNDIIDEVRIPKANEMLNILRTRMIQSLHQKDFSEDNRDGMDISLTILDKETQQIEYAGAYHPLYLVRDGKLIDYKPERMSISIQSQLDKSFQNNIIPSKTGDMIYLSTDGYPDQISGSSKKKMTRKNFKGLLETIAQFDMGEQQIKLEEYLEQWQEDYEQVDDILVIGFRV